MTMDRTNLSTMTTALHVAARTATMLPEPSGVRFEECSGCGRYYQLLRVGKVWIQTFHNCDEEKSLWR